MKVLLLDIEGTTTPIDFVYQVLFPYARAHMTDYLSRQFDPEDQALLKSEYAAEHDPARPAWSDPPIEYLLWLMDQDRKSRGLKSIQGKIWETGYRNGSLRGDVYPDVPPALECWRKAGNRTFIYSSGSVQAQRLLFTHSTDGDLSGLISGYFDTEVGPKRDPESYRTIAHRIGVPAPECLFISDVAAECDAAHAAGFNVLLAVRPGNPPQQGQWAEIHSLDEIFSRISTATGRR